MPNSKVLQNQATHKKLGISLAITAALLSGYGSRKAYAGTCTTVGGGTYNCTGATNAATDMTVSHAPGTPLTITTANGFGIDTTLGGRDAFFLVGQPPGLG